MSVELPVRSPSVLPSQSGPDTILYHTTRREVHVLNPTASYVWERCDGAHSVDAIAEQAAADFEQAPPTLGQEVRDVVERLRSLHLVE